MSKTVRPDFREQAKAHDVPKRAFDGTHWS